MLDRPLTPKEQFDHEYESAVNISTEAEHHFEHENGYHPLRDISDAQPGDVYTAWELIGYECESGHWLRIKGGRALYEAVLYNDSNYHPPGQEKVKLARLDTHDGLREAARFVEPETEIEIV